MGHLKNTWKFCYSSVQFSHSVVSDSLWPHGLQYTRPPCPSPAPRVYSNSYPLSRWCHPTNSSSVIPFSSSLQSSHFIYLETLSHGPLIRSLPSSRHSFSTALFLTLPPPLHVLCPSHPCWAFSSDRMEVWWSGICHFTLMSQRGLHGAWHRVGADRLWALKALVPRPGLWCLNSLVTPPPLFRSL